MGWSWACLAHMYTENIKETELPSRALPSMAKQQEHMHIGTTIPNPSKFVITAAKYQPW